MGIEESKKLARRVWEDVWHQGNSDAMAGLFATEEC